MSKSERLNGILQSEHPAAAALLSPLGREAAFPKGIPAQSREARDCRYKATIGQITDGQGNPIPLPSMATLLGDLEPKTAFLYSPQGGFPDLREAWARRILAEATQPITISKPLVTLALTHGLSLTADLFADPSTDVIMPAPSWGNYKAIYKLRRGANLVTWPCFNGDQRLNLDGLAAALSQVRTKAVVLLNFPGNPTGFTPDSEDVAGLMEVLLAHRGTPLAVVCDDAYQGLYHEPSVHQRSIFYDLAAQASPEWILPIKVDGATKELAFFGGRVGFLTFAAGEAASDALNDKAIAICRATVSSLPGPSQQVVLRALENPNLQLEVDALRETLAVRYRTLKAGLEELKGTGVTPYPFNSGCFALLGLPSGLNAGQLRKRLIEEFSVGLIAIESENALRIAYCSMAEEDLQPMLERIKSAISGGG